MMDRTEELMKLLDDLLAVGNQLVETASSLRECLSAAPTDAEETEAAATSEPEKKAPLTKTDARALLVRKSNEADGKYKPQVKALVQKYSGGSSLSAVRPDQYEALVAELEVIGNA